MALTCMTRESKYWLHKVISIPPPILPKKKGFFKQHPQFRLDFIIKCQAQIDLHRLSGTSLNALAWKTVKDELNNIQEFHVLQHKELKNQWDYLKRQWKIWRGLINWTSHGYDPISGTFDWPEEVWENIIALIYEARKYKTAPLHHRDLPEKLHEGLSATGDFAWSSGMVSVPSSTQQSDYVPLPDDINVDDTQVPLAGVDYPWDGEAIPTYDAPISPVREPTPGSTSRSRTPTPQSNRKRSAAAIQPLEPTELVQSLISAFTAQGASQTSGSNDDTSDAVVQVLQEMVSSYEIDNVLFFKSLKFLVGSNEHTYRLMFIRLRPEQRVSFLEALMS
ncbi:hypothetical protein GIB67_039735 [Kingdonia uniflora]|uniref:Myb/SANT-like domain-containing protein n=1 Tax=Kingdonia uniflora TaxID=39325 RepID=A0A7J7MQ61_9MAGN|nr:hypothetical protein GIB67_039735 [Kingdonia uniflora]